MHVAHLRAVIGGFPELQCLDVGVGNRQRETVAERQQCVVFHFFLLVRAHLALAPMPHAVTLFCLGEDHRRPAVMVHRSVIGGVNLHRVMAAATQAVDVFIRQVRYQRLQVGVLVEKLFAVEAAVSGGVFLELAVDGFVQAFEDDVFCIACEQRIPFRAPQ